MHTKKYISIKVHVAFDKSKLFPSYSAICVRAAHKNLLEAFNADRCFVFFSPCSYRVVSRVKLTVCLIKSNLCEHDIMTCSRWCPKQCTSHSAPLSRIYLCWGWQKQLLHTRLMTLSGLSNGARYTLKGRVAILAKLKKITQAKW